MVILAVWEGVLPVAAQANLPDSSFLIGPGRLVFPMALAWDGKSLLIGQADAAELLSYREGRFKVLAHHKCWSLKVATPDGGVYLCDPVAGEVIELGSGRSFPFISPVGLCVSGNVLYVLQSDGVLWQVDRTTGKRSMKAYSGRGGAYGLAYVRGRFIVSFPSRGEVWEYPRGRGKPELLLTGLDLPTTLLERNGKLWLVETERGTVWEYDLDTLARKVVVQENPGLVGLAVGDRHEIWVSNVLDGAVRKYSPQGEAEILSPPGAGGGRLRFELENRLFVMGLTSVELSSTDGNTIFGPLLYSFFDYPASVWGVVDSTLDSEGQVYYTVTHGGKVMVRRGERLRTLTEGLNNPSGMVVGEGGTLYVAESGTGRVVAVVAGGVIPVAIGLGEPVDLAYVLGQGLYVLDRQGGRLLRIDKRGAVGVIAEGLKYPSSMAVVPGQGFVVLELDDYAVNLYSPQGKFVKALYRFDPSQLKGREGPPWRSLGGVAVDPVHKVLFVSVPGLQGIITVPLK